MFAVARGRIIVPITHVYLARRKNEGLEAFVCSANIERSMTNDLGSTPFFGRRIPGVLGAGRYEKLAHYTYNNIEWGRFTDKSLGLLSIRGVPIIYSNIESVSSEYQGGSGDYRHIMFDRNVNLKDLTDFFASLNPAQL